MAIQTLNLTVADGENHTSLVSINYDGDITVANMTLIAALAITALEGVIEGSVVKASISRVLLSAVSTAAAASDVEIKARFIWDVASTVKSVVMSIPTFLRSKILPNSDRVDLTDADVLTFIDAIVDGVTIATVDYPAMDTEQRDILAVKSAVEAYSRKR